MPEHEKDERRSIYDLEGLQLLGSALWHGYEWWSQDQIGRGRERALERTIYIRSLLSELDTPTTIIEEGRNAKITDFWFSPEILFLYPRFVYFLIEPATVYCPIVDRQTEISRNRDVIEGGTLCPLFVEMAEVRLHMRPAREPGGSDAMFGVFRELVDPVVRTPRGRGAPPGPRYEDHRDEAATDAAYYFYSGNVTRSEAVRLALRNYRVLPPGSDPKGARFVYATNQERGEKLVFKDLTERLRGEGVCFWSDLPPAAREDLEED